MTKITQADREAAAAFYGTWGATKGWQHLEEPIRKGLVDDNALVQAFARHRSGRMEMTENTPSDALVEAMTDEAKALVYRMRNLQVLEYPQDRIRCADLIETQAREIERLRRALVAEREENLWSAYATGDVRGDEWTHLYMSDGEWLVRQCGLDPKQGYYKAEQIRNAIPIAARAALAGDSHD